MDLKEVFGSARAEHEPQHPTPAARPILVVEAPAYLFSLKEQPLRESAAAGVDHITMKPLSRDGCFEMFETDELRVREFAMEAACPRS